MPGLKTKTILIVQQESDFSKRFSSYNRLLRVTAWIRRFYNNSRSKSISQRNLSQNLCAEKLNEAETSLFCIHQNQYFLEELKSLKKGQTLNKSSSLRTLNPLIDKHGVLRVGGRLNNTTWNYSIRHPPILYGSSHFARLLIRQRHLDRQHSGPTTLIGTLSAEVYLTSSRRVIRDVTRACIICKRQYAKMVKQQMGQLPVIRATPSLPFQKVGVDLAGPLLVKLGRIRKPTLVKTYVAVFVCFSTRAVHLEAVMDLTTESFLAALKIFVSRRGLPTLIQSDNGTNFVGAHKELSKAYQQLEELHEKEEVAYYLSTNRIQWKHVPSWSPNFGGLWETAVKSFKLLLRKIVGTATFTQEELSTLLTQVEATLNSRPLLPIETLPEDDISVLTPGHFLIGRPLTALPPITSSTWKTFTLRRWNFVQRLSDELWKRWSGEYLQSLNKFTKWFTPHNNLPVGDIVLCKDLPEIRPQAWPIAVSQKQFLVQMALCVLYSCKLVKRLSKTSKKDCFSFRSLQYGSA